MAFYKSENLRSKKFYLEALQMEIYGNHQGDESVRLVSDYLFVI